MRAATAVAFSLFFVAAEARADDNALAVLLPKLAVSSARFESMLKKASFTVMGKMETVGGDGALSDPKEGIFKIVNDGKGNVKVEIVRYAEDGKDKTDDAKKKAE